MPSFRFLFVVKASADAGDEVVELPPGTVPAGQVVVASAQARRLVDYLLSLNRNYPRADARAAGGMR